MARKRGFTLVELLVVMAIIILLVAMMLPSVFKMYVPLQHVSCLANMRQLSMAWMEFTFDHDGKLVNGEGGYEVDQLPWRIPNVKEQWLGKAWHNKYDEGKQIPEKEQIDAIKYGTLYPYINDIDVYRCPTGFPGDMVTYEIMDSMNGRGWQNGRRVQDKDFVGVPHTFNADPDRAVQDAYIIRMNEIHSAERRMVFIDEGWITPDSYAVYYHKEEWWDDPPIRHANGMTATFADGSARLWRWEGEGTIAAGIEKNRVHNSSHYRPEGWADYKDFYRFQIATYGTSCVDPAHGYKPKHPDAAYEAMWE